MDYRDIQRHLAQLSRCIKKSRFNKYSDPRKDLYQEKLMGLYDLILIEDFSGLTPSQIADKKTIVDFIFQNIQFLDNSTLTISPFEIVYCLERILEEWIPRGNFIVTTSLSNNLKDFYLDGTLITKTAIYDLIKNQYNIDFNYRLIQISLPRFFVHDYLANVTLYHELGHFIDLYFSISKTIVNNQIIGGELDKEYQDIATRHHMEFFADIFAAQYIGNSLNHFLNYIAYNHGVSPTHPSTNDRLEIVNEFLTGNTTEPLITSLKNETKNRTNLNLEIRHTSLETSDFDDLIPIEINNKIELHSIFLAGWNFWKSSNNNMINQFGPERSYKIINNLIEKSISNFMVIDSWNK